MRLIGKVAIVTGAGRGIGRAIARGYAREGADLVIAELDAEAGRDAAGEVDGLGRRARFIETDVSRTDQIERMVGAAIAEFGRIDVLVNNAGIHASQPFLNVTEESFDLV